uniref:DUF148 domain-containing protein n=1 Tax=Panagrellus redivivus TaxID=6233 RepID=A0A7E4VC47_PANRE
MFKLVVALCAVSAVAALPLSGCPLDGAKDIFKSLTTEQQAEVKSIFAEASAPGSTVTKAQLEEKLNAVKAQLSPELQAKIAEITPTGLPALPANLSAEAQQVANEIKDIITNKDSTIAADREQIKGIIEKASPAVQAELKEANPAKNCAIPTPSA